MEYYVLGGATTIAPEALTIPRAFQLYAALMRNPECDVVDVMTLTRASGPMEAIIADVTCEGVGNRNKAGIKYVERIALIVPGSAKELVDVRAMRREFPRLQHQNRTVPGDITSLCLYFEPASVVTRTWTPEKFIKKIQWWLAKAAAGELHAADQPAEALFFNSEYELILPADYGAVRDAGTSFVISKVVDRPNNCKTLFLAAARPEEERVAVPISIDTPSVVHGSIEADPSTLGELADILDGRGVDLHTMVHNALRTRVTPQGVKLRSEQIYTILLLRVPISLAPDTPPSKVSYRAFFVDSSPLDLGVAVGALFELDGLYYVDNQLGSTPLTSEKWRALTVAPMEVLSMNTREAARKQSGIVDEGPNGTLVGVGALGSTLINLWARSGWGRWTLVDQDHIKPHNLSRHTSVAAQIGTSKARATHDLVLAAGDHSSCVAALTHDALNLADATFKAALLGSTLVVDASTTLEYPRAVSADSTLPRHCSVFVSPSGNGAVLLAEDRLRKVTLRSLEAQYYRAVIQQEWGAAHLQGHLGRFWSGASCRDISMVLPYSRVMNHASTLAEQIMLAERAADAFIGIWERDAQTGAVRAHVIESALEHRIELGSTSVYYDAAIERRVRVLREAALPNETGGILLGYHDFNFDMIVIVDALPAPADSISLPTSFKRGTDGVAGAVHDAQLRTAQIVSYIGEWHTHPRGHSAQPSHDDIIQLAGLAAGMSDDGLPAIQLIVGETDIQILIGALQNPADSPDPT